VNGKNIDMNNVNMNNTNVKNINMNKISKYTFNFIKSFYKQKIYKIMKFIFFNMKEKSKLIILYNSDNIIFLEYFSITEVARSINFITRTISKALKSHIFLEEYEAKMQEVVRLYKSIKTSFSGKNYSIETITKISLTKFIIVKIIYVKIGTCETLEVMHK